uniref:ShKT domain-containing protein n=1 Tax=Acrobeloides nanus TaxID=290746 RepID=A0A914BVD0_9BILA
MLFAESGANHHPCSNEYVGESPFSEPESRAVNDFLTSQEMTHKLNAFITLHTYAQLWIHPFSHEVEYYPNDITRLLNVAEKAVSRLRDVYGTQYRVGTGADLLYPAAGGSDDWAKEKLGAKYVYLIELRPQLEQSNGFILKQEELIPTAIESFEGIKVVIEAVLEDNGIPISKLLKASNRHENMHPRVHAVPNYNEEQEEKFHDGRFGNFDSFQNIPPINFSPNQQDSSNNSVFITKVNLSVIPNLPATSTAAPSPNPTYTTPEQTNYYKQTASSTPSSSSQPSSSSTTTSHPSTSTVTITNPTTTISTTSSSTPSTTPSTTHSTTTSLSVSSSTTKQTLNPTVTTTSETTTSTQAPNSSSTSTIPSSTTASTVSEKDNTTIVAISTTTTSSMPSTPLYEVNMAMAITPIDIQSTIYSDEPINSTESNIITTPTLGQVTEITLETSRAKLYNELLLRKQLLRWRSLNLISPHITSTLKTTATDPIAYREEMAIDTTKPAGVNSAPRFLTSIPVQADRENLWPSLRIRNTLPPVVQLPPLVVGGLKKAVSENPLRYVPTTACEDKKYSCTFWIKADRNVCVDQARFMKLNCPFSCNFCTRS